MHIRFYRDPDTGEPHILRPWRDGSGGFSGASTVRAKTCRPPTGAMALGQTAGGRYFRVIYVPDPEPDSVFVVTAYELRGKPLTAYRRRQRRRRR